MGWTDILLMVLIAGGAVYVLYRSLRKKKGGCDGCSGCEIKGKGGPKDCSP